MAKIKKDITIIIKGEQARVLLDLANECKIEFGSPDPHFCSPDLKGSPQFVSVKKNVMVSLYSMIDHRKTSILGDLFNDLQLSSKTSD